ncbi:MAG: hypothetical protein O3B24_04600 [Verrucomicrobia bacterium]|nr:hypothetical protein [Verrucomicrobiota bacterium]
MRRYNGMGGYVAWGCACGLVATLVLAQESDRDPMQGLTNFVQASGRMPPTPFTSDQEQQVLQAVFSRFPNVDPHAMMEYIATHNPDDMQRYTLLSMQNLSEALPLLMGLVRDSLELQALETRRPEQYARAVRYQELERRAQELAAPLEGAHTPEAADAARLAELRAVLMDAFEAKQELMRSDVAEIQAQVDELENLLREREAKRDEIVARRLAELADGAQGQW